MRKESRLSGKKEATFSCLWACDGKGLSMQADVIRRYDKNWNQSGLVTLMIFGGMFSRKKHYWLVCLFRHYDFYLLFSWGGYRFFRQ